MKKLTGLFLCAIAIIGTGCPSPTACIKGELRFENPPPVFALGTTFSNPRLQYNNGNGLAVGLNKTIHQNGQQGFNKSEVINNPPFLFGTKQDLHMHNTVLNFDLEQNTQKVEFEYLDRGGTINLGAHGTANLFIGNMFTMPATMIINGVTIKKSNVQDFNSPQGVKVAEKGTITLTYNADIGGMIIGGEELYLDNFCFN